MDRHGVRVVIIDAVVAVSREKVTNSRLIAYDDTIPGDAPHGDTLFLVDMPWVVLNKQFTTALAPYSVRID